MEKCNHKKLFNEYELSSLLTNKIKGIKSQVESINEKVFLHTPAEKIVSRLVLENLPDQLKLYEHFIRVRHPMKCTTDSSDSYIKNTNDHPNHCLIDSIKVRIEIPFSGDDSLWLSRPTIFNVDGGPDFCVKNRKIAKEYIQTMFSENDQIKSEFLQNLSEIKRYLNWQDMDIQQYREELRKIVEETVAKRLAKLKKQESLSTNLNIDMKPRNRSADFCPINIRKKISHPYDNNNEKETEPSISEDDFINIIRLVRHIGRSCERTPHVFRVHKERELRDIISSSLNTQFEDCMSNDLFVKEGNTAISISQNGKCAFLGTCKIWSSENQFQKTIDHFLESDFWNDGKATLIIFNKTIKDFPKLLSVAKKIIMKHPKFMSYDKKFDENEWNFTMRTMNDSACRINLQAMIFNLYAEQTNAHLRLTGQEMDFFKS